MKNLFRKPVYGSLICGLAAVLLLGLLPITAAQAQEGRVSLDEERIVERAKDALMKELRESDFLKKEIERGIQAYLEKQRQAQSASVAARQRLADEKIKDVRRVSSARDHIYGDPKAAISLIEYSDFECPFCKRFHPTAKKIVEASAGKVNWVYRHFPLRFHNPGAQKQAEAAECANELGGNDAFWQYTDAIYARTRSNGKGFALAKLTPLAQEIGLDGEKFQQCLNSEKYAARVLEDVAEGEAIGVIGTPATIILHNRTGAARLKTGALPFAAFKADIEEMLDCEGCIKLGQSVAPHDVDGSM